MKKGRYIGPIHQLKNQIALLREFEDTNKLILAQFDVVSLVHPYTQLHLGYDWHTFRKDEFEIENDE